MAGRGAAHEGDGEWSEWLRLQYTTLRSEVQQALTAQQAILQWSLGALSALVAGAVVLLGDVDSPQTGEAGTVLLLVFGLGIPGATLASYLVWWGELLRMERAGQFLRGVEAEVARGFPGRMPPLQWEHFLGSRPPGSGGRKARGALAGERKLQLGYIGAAGIYLGFAVGSLAVFGSLAHSHVYALGRDPWPSWEKGGAYFWIGCYLAVFGGLTLRLKHRARQGATRGYRLSPALPTDIAWYPSEVPTPRRAVVAFSFGLRGDAEPGPVNTRLAREVQRVVAEQKPTPLVVAQWEVARQLSADGMTPDLVVERPAGSRYLDTEAVWQQAEEFLRQRQVWSVVPVAQPFLHVRKVRRLIEASGFQPVTVPLGRVGFDTSPVNEQWWTRGPLRLVLYAVLQGLTGRRGH